MAAIDFLSGLTPGDSSSERLKSQAGNVPGRVRVAVVDRPARTARPLPYYKAGPTFRTAPKAQAAPVGSIQPDIERVPPSPPPASVSAAKSRSRWSSAFRLLPRSSFLPVLDRIAVNLNHPDGLSFLGGGKDLCRAAWTVSNLI